MRTIIYEIRGKIMFLQGRIVQNQMQIKWMQSTDI